MRNISFKRKESVLRTLEIQQDRKVRKPVNWDRLIYFVLLILFAFFLGRYLINKYFFIEADGQVLFDSVDIRNTDDCRIIDFHVRAGDEVEIGDSLFTYYLDNDKGGASFGSYDFAMKSKKGGDLSWAEKEIFKLEEDVKMLSAKLSEQRKLQKSYEEDLQRIRNEVMLDALPRSRYDDQVQKINGLKSDARLTSSEISAMRSSIDKLKAMIKDTSTSTTVNSTGQGAGNGGNDNGRQIFYSPIEGAITRINKQVFETALKSETILSIHKPENVYIKAFFKQEDLKSLRKEDVVTLNFPDGTISEGIISEFYSATYRLPEEFQKKYEPTTRSLSADILPKNKEDLLHWKTYWKMAVSISKSKY